MFSSKLLGLGMLILIGIYINKDSRKEALTAIFVKVDQDNLTIIEVYVDDIIFGSNDDRLSKDLATKMQSEFEMSMLGKLTYFLGL